MRRAVLWFLVACGGARSSPPQTAPLVATPEAAEAAYDARDWAECAVQWRAVASQVTGEAKSGAFYDAASCYALDGRSEPAFAALDAALEAGYWDVEHMLGDADLASLRTLPRWSGLAHRAQTNFAAFEASLGDPALRVELIALAAKVEVGELGDATAKLEAAIAKHGWPSKRIVGSDGANAAWVIAQNSDAPAFQKRCLELMEPLAKTGEVAGRDYAFLFDRVAILQGRRQRYGTQLDGDELAPLEDPARVDELRRTVGLESLAAAKARRQH